MQFTDNQTKRLLELGGTFDAEYSYTNAKERDQAFLEMERSCLENNRRALHVLREERKAPSVNQLSMSISSFLRDKGFLEVSTPLIISKDFLNRMTIGDDHALYKQVFWLDDKTCLRPMLAPNLYDISKRMLNIYGRPLGVFEIGPCFRKESAGNKHLETFTMVNFVEWGVEESEKVDRFKELASKFMAHIGLADFNFEEEDSVVYGTTIDVEVSGVEIASGAFGHHPLDTKWEYEGTWLGLGAGLERIVMMKEDLDSIHKAGRSLRYLGGISLNIKAPLK